MTGAFSLLFPLSLRERAGVRDALSFKRGMSFHPCSLTPTPLPKGEGFN